ncbi:DUF2637 domain-containing protein [Kitasatospora kifunensis]|uniref:DUF2637 domain-containing protein n=1 Tax=Kitasatospora kifunensis TaxID=58351 RepID=A0A7W7R9Z7_KITKI|nr:DUF2637 domain-containing protein [Kitasatospora kifunensis]MBB4928143.1 hypothetical protein [Kitasatospora kifunensis]
MDDFFPYAEAMPERTFADPARHEWPTAVTGTWLNQRSPRAEETHGKSGPSWAFDSLFRSVVEEKFDQAPPADRIPPSPAIGAKRARAHAAGMGPRTFSSFFGILTAATVTLVSLVAWVFSYGPMQVLASSGMRHGLAQIWPVVIFGPWLVACLSILRAAFDQRRIGLSWAVVVMFSSTAAALSIATVSHTPASVVVCGLPPITSVISFHQLVRQIGASMTPGPLQPPSRRGARHRADPAGRASA